ncbi:thiolase family protein [Achromobacter marplatensis]|uniref:thiolase family protein n=1 Tax=Achromobacter marplatensis TaxID=470868 RepID=UPI000277DFD1|nr:thiolase family protein [Achromobacter marplatensis]EJO30458.1 acetyl-CoA acetyltransferase [Achromobacter marplatensis]
MNEAVIVEAVRTPFGRRDGWWADTRPDTLLAQTVQGLLARAGLPGAQVEDLIAGCVSQAGEQGANIGRLAAMLAGLPESVPGVALNRMCGSSQQAVHFGAQAIAAGDMRYVVAGGVESMSRVPMFLDVTLGQGEFRGFESLNPALLERYPLIHQIESAERIADHWQLSQAAMDEWARESHARAWAAAKAGRHAELLPGPQGGGHRDEGIREATDPARMAAMAPAMRAPGQGGVTAANASQLADGAAAVLLADRDTALADGLRPRARFRARVVVGSDPVMQLTGVIPATRLALARAGLTLEDIDWIEINEAFASVVLAWQRELDAKLSRVNPWGGAIAHGHPLGATGAGLMAKMLAGLEASEGEFGLQLMCIGHGMATATIIQRL